MTGTVQAYDLGHSITITNNTGEQTTYTINSSSTLPKTIEVGKTVTLKTYTVSGTPIVKTVTVTRTSTNCQHSTCAGPAAWTAGLFLSPQSGAVHVTSAASSLASRRGSHRTSSETPYTLFRSKSGTIGISSITSCMTRL